MAFASHYENYYKIILIKAMQSANIKVAVRIRPMLDDELKAGQLSHKLQVDQDSQTINAYNDRLNQYKNVKFDYVLDTTASQKKVFDQIGVNQMVQAVVEGYHATIFAYGQTGSGKTFTMEGYKYQRNEKGIPQAVFETGGDNEGLVPRSINYLYDLIKQQTVSGHKKITVYCSYLQIYKEKIYDMLNKSQIKRLVADGPGLKLKWNKYDHFSVENLYTFECKTPDDVLALYHFGIKNKVVASHNMNNASSRSHSVLCLTVEAIDQKNPDNIVVSKLQLVDLAGSERQSQTGNQTNKESIDINKSLFTLRQVITALTEQTNNVTVNTYVPYRDSKLTCLLRQSLGGNSFCLMIACLNPCDAHIDENMNTLQYASKASFISNKPIRNDDPKSRMIEELKAQVRVLTEELSKANQTIQFLSQITGNNHQTITENIKNFSLEPYPTNTGSTYQDINNINKIILNQPGNINKAATNIQRSGSASSAITEKRDATAGAVGALNSTVSNAAAAADVQQKNIERIIIDKDNIEQFFKEKSDKLNLIATGQSFTNNPQGVAANQQKDAITERIIHTVNMMKEVLQSNLSLRETIQSQSEVIERLNAELFQMQNENEDLRDRLIVMEDFTGRDSVGEVHKLFKDKKVLENRVKHLEQTNQNWQQFQTTKQQFYQSKDNGAGGGGGQQVQQSQQNMLGMQPKATLEGKFNDDYEPMRCAVMQDDSSFNNGIGVEEVPRLPSTSNKKKKKLVKGLNYQKQAQRGKSTIADRHLTIEQQQQLIIQQQLHQQQQYDKHQEYKIRTVRSLAMAYQQQQQQSYSQSQHMTIAQQQNSSSQQQNSNLINGNKGIANQTSRTVYQNGSGTAGNKFGGSQSNTASQMNTTTYKGLNRAGYGNGSQFYFPESSMAEQVIVMPDINLNDTSMQQQYYNQQMGGAVELRSKSPTITNHALSSQKVQHKAALHVFHRQTTMNYDKQQQSSLQDIYPADLYQNRDQIVLLAQPHITLRRKEQLSLAASQGGNSSGQKPPKQLETKNSKFVSKRGSHNGSASAGGYNGEEEQTSDKNPFTMDSNTDSEIGSATIKGRPSQPQQFVYDSNGRLKEENNMVMIDSDAYEAAQLQSNKIRHQQQQQQMKSQGYTRNDNTSIGGTPLDVSLPKIKNS